MGRARERTLITMSVCGCIATLLLGWQLSHQQLHCEAAVTYSVCFS